MQNDLAHVETFVRTLFDGRHLPSAAELLGRIAEPGDLVLIKGSRLTRTEDVIEYFAKQEGARV